MRISKSFRRVGPSLAIAASAAALACSSTDKKSPNSSNGGGSGSDASANASADWTMYGYDSASTYWNKAETKLTLDNASKLEKVWEFDGGGGVTATPVIADGKVFFLSSGLYALDLATHDQLWVNPRLPGYASLAYADHVLYVHDLTGILHAVSDADGTELWAPN